AWIPRLVASVFPFDEFSSPEPVLRSSSMPSRPSVLISATSHDLGSYRAALRTLLPTLDVKPVVLEHYPPDFPSLVEMLRETIAGCDAVICLVGRVYGEEPQPRQVGQPR